MGNRAFGWAAWLVTIDTDSIAGTREGSRRHFLKQERGFLHDGGEHLDDRELWKRFYKKGWRIVPIEIKRLNGAVGGAR